MTAIPRIKIIEYHSSCSHNTSVAVFAENRLTSFRHVQTRRLEASMRRVNYGFN